MPLGGGKPRKGPPKFQHLPLAQARKLKKAWVDAKKIKTAYKAEKRKGTGASLPSKMPVDAADGDEYERGDGIDAAEEDRNVEKEAASEDELDDAHAQKSPRKQSSSPPSPPPSRTPHPFRRKSLKQSPSTSNSKPNPKSAEEETEREQRIQLRNLTREAYSKDTLHNFKSDPLGRRRKQGGDGYGGKRGDQQGQGRGQPDMKKRMDVLLAKLQMDAAKR